MLCQANILDTELRRHRPKQEVVTAAATEARISILCDMLMVLLSTNKLVCRSIFWLDLTYGGLLVANTHVQCAASPALITLFPQPHDRDHDKLTLPDPVCSRSERYLPPGLL